MLSNRFRFAKLKKRILRQRIYSRFRQYTMVPKDIYLINLQLAETVAKTPGCVVECGVWRGGMIAGIAALLGPSRTYVLFDSFEGLPPPKDIDGLSAAAWCADKSGPFYFNNCTADISEAERAMKMSGANDYRFIKGWFEDTIPAFVPPEPIALLRLDGDWFESTLICLKHLHTRLAPGGVVIVDDYYTWDGCARAVHTFLAGCDRPYRVGQAQNKVCFILT